MGILEIIVRLQAVLEEMETTSPSIPSTIRRHAVVGTWLIFVGSWFFVFFLTK